MNANLQKYLKYKAKYLDLKNELEGGKLDPQLYEEIKDLQKKISSLDDKFYLNQHKIDKKEEIKNQFVEQIEKENDEIDKLENAIRTTRGRGMDRRIQDLNAKKTGHEGKIQKFKNQFDKIEEDINTMIADNFKIKKEIKNLKDELELKKANVGNDSTKKIVFGALKNRIHKPEEYEETMKTSVVDNDALLIKIKQNMNTIYNLDYQDNDANANSEYLLKIFELTSEFVSKLTHAMDTQNFEEQQKSIKDYSDSENQKNKIGSGFQYINKIRGDLSKLKDSGMTEEYNKLLKKVNDLKEISEDFKLI
jgi:chromosome segregation ATPase